MNQVARTSRIAVAAAVTTGAVTTAVLVRVSWASEDDIGWPKAASATAALSGTAPSTT